MSANFVLDLGNAAFMEPSIFPPALSGVVGSASGAIIGAGVDMLQAHGYTNLVAMGLAAFSSGGGGELRIGVQCAPSDVSGNYTDPTSGLAFMPTAFQSGGILYINSGSNAQLSGGGGIFGTFVSGQAPLSGFMCAAAFQRTGRYVRAIMFGSGTYGGSLQVGFVEQLRTTGSGGGFAWSPQASGQTVNV